jgi:hypothetical protein
MITAVCPCGPTSSMSVSAGNVWANALSLTVTFASWFGIFVTLIPDGYGVPGPPDGMVIEVEFVNVLTIPGPKFADDELAKVWVNVSSSGTGGTSCATDTRGGLVSDPTTSAMIIKLATYRPDKRVKIPSPKPKIEDVP